MNSVKMYRKMMKLADARCRSEHPEYYQDRNGDFGPPCDECIEEAKKELELLE